MNDELGLSAAAAALTSTGLFALVSVEPYGPVNPMVSPTAAIRAVSWSTTTSWSDATAEARVRTVRFEVLITARWADGARDTPTLQELAQAAEDAVQGSSLGGTCLPALTRLEDGRYPRASASPEESVTLTGQFSYLR